MSSKDDEKLTPWDAPLPSSKSTTALQAQAALQAQQQQISAPARNIQHLLSQLNAGAPASPPSRWSRIEGWFSFTDGPAIYIFHLLIIAMNSIDIFFEPKIDHTISGIGIGFIAGMMLHTFLSRQDRKMAKSMANMARLDGELKAKMECIQRHGTI